MIISAYRKADYADPMGFVTQLGVVLEAYPEWIVRYVTDPTTGIQRRQTFPPSIAEVVSACEELYSPIRFAERWDEQARKQAEEQRALPAPRHYSANVLTYREAEKIMEAKRGVRVLGPFDQGRTIAYRG
jgi:hypothetical protein